MSRPRNDPLARLASLLEARKAAHGDWHDLTALWSIQADIEWMLRVTEAALVLIDEPWKSPAGKPSRAELTERLRAACADAEPRR